MDGINDRTCEDAVVVIERLPRLDSLASSSLSWMMVGDLVHDRASTHSERVAYNESGRRGSDASTDSVVTKRMPRLGSIAPVVEENNNKTSCTSALRKRSPTLEIICQTVEPAVVIERSPGMDALAILGKPSVKVHKMNGAPFVCVLHEVSSCGSSRRALGPEFDQVSTLASIEKLPNSDFLARQGKSIKASSASNASSQSLGTENGITIKPAAAVVNRWPLIDSLARLGKSSINVKELYNETNTIGSRVSSGSQRPLDTEGPKTKINDPVVVMERITCIDSLTRVFVVSSFGSTPPVSFDRTSSGFASTTLNNSHIRYKIVSKNPNHRSQSHKPPSLFKTAISEVNDQVRNSIRTTRLSKTLFMRSLSLRPNTASTSSCNSAPNTSCPSVFSDKNSNINFRCSQKAHKRALKTHEFDSFQTPLKRARRVSTASSISDTGNSEAVSTATNSQVDNIALALNRKCSVILHRVSSNMLNDANRNSSSKSYVASSESSALKKRPKQLVVCLKDIMDEKVNKPFCHTQYESTCCEFSIPLDDPNCPAVPSSSSVGSAQLQPLLSKCRPDVIKDLSSLSSREEDIIDGTTKKRCESASSELLTAANKNGSDIPTSPGSSYFEQLPTEPVVLLEDVMDGNSRQPLKYSQHESTSSEAVVAAHKSTSNITMPPEYSSFKRLPTELVVCLEDVIRPQRESNTSEYSDNLENIPPVSCSSSTDFTQLQPSLSTQTAQVTNPYLSRRGFKLPKELIDRYMKEQVKYNKYIAMLFKCDRENALDNLLNVLSEDDE